MVEWLRSWANQIIVAVIIAVIFELIIPKGKNKKYIKMVINLYVLFVIINPIISNFIDEDTLDLSKYSQYLKIENTVSINSDYNSENLINSTFEKSLKEDIKNKLFLEGYKTTNISIRINKDNSQINWIKLEVIKLDGENKNEDKNNENSNIKIENIEGVNINTNTNKEEILKKAEIEKIKKILSEEYNISENSIEIN